MVESVRLTAGERIYLTWVYDDRRRIVKLLSDAASLEALQAESRKRISERLAREGMTGFVEAVDRDTARVLIFATWWAQGNELKPGQKLRLQTTDSAMRPMGEAMAGRIVTRKNLGTYGSGCNELVIENLAADQARMLRDWTGGKVVRVFAP